MEIMTTLIFFFSLVSLGLVLFASYCVWEMRENFFSYVDFSDNKLSSIEGRIAPLEEFDKTMASLVDEDLYRVITFLQYQIDINRLEFETHLNLYSHLNDEGKSVKAETALEQSFTLAQLENQILETAKKLNIDHTIKSKRLKGK